jgi:hypothetical protein
MPPAIVAATANSSVLAVARAIVAANSRVISAPPALAAQQGLAGRTRGASATPSNSPRWPQKLVTVVFSWGCPVASSTSRSPHFRKKLEDSSRLLINVAEMIVADRSLLHFDREGPCPSRTAYHTR